MAALKFNKCCFCIELKTGCFIIGYLSLVGYLILTIMALMMLLAGVAISASDDEAHPDNKEIGVSVLVASGVLLLVTVVLLTFVIVLLVGLHKNKPGHVKAFLIYYVIFIVVMILQVIGSAASGNAQPRNIAQNVISVLVSIYFLLVIRSQYLVMKSQSQRGPAIYNTA